MKIISTIRLENTPTIPCQKKSEKKTWVWRHQQINVYLFYTLLLDGVLEQKLNERKNSLN